MAEKFNIHKAGGILIKDRKLLVEKSYNKNFFIAPGGSIEPGETAEQALVRELAEEFKIIVKAEDFRAFGTFYAPAAGREDLIVRIDAMLVEKWQGEPEADNEVEQIRWINSNIPSDIKVGSIFEHQVIPRLKELDLID